MRQSSLWGNPHKNVITPQKVDEKILLRDGRNAEGGNAMLPLGCFPLWGTEGVTFITFLKKNTTFDRISAEQEI
jgi:hypothetical protein